MGEFLPFQLWRLDSRYRILKDQKLERLPSEYFGSNIFITTSGVFSPAALAGAVLAVGEDAILFSIDYPYESTELAVSFLHSAPLSRSAREKIAWRNAEQLLKIG
jgi:2,3-dihydroxybenzoate decarboxylase